MQRIYVWGTGVNANRLVRNNLCAELLGFIETDKQKDWFLDKKVYHYSEIIKEYDAIIVASRYSSEIYLCAEEWKMDMEKFIFLYPGANILPKKKWGWAEQILGEKNFEWYCCQYGIYNKTFYARDKALYMLLNKRKSFEIDEKDVYPMVQDKFANAGTVSSYFWQDLWAASLIYKNKPLEHYDIGSRLDGFIAHLLSFNIPVNMIDIRQFPVEVPGLKTIIGDATNMEQFEDNSIESLSALCSLEHFGLGRYGDPIDPEACFKCFVSIQKKMKKGGKLYISVPVGKERLQFNAHRIFNTKTIIESFNKMRLLEFSCTASGKIEKNVAISKYDDDIQSRGARLGLFYFEKME